MGRTTGTYEFTPEELEQKFDEFRAEMDSHIAVEVSAGKKVEVNRPRVYSLKMFLARLPLSRQAWSKYKQRKEYEEVCEYIDDFVYARKEDAMLNGEGNGTGLIFDMKVNYGWKEKTYLEGELMITEVKPEVIGSLVPLATNEKEVDV